MGANEPAFPCHTDKVEIDTKGERVIPVLNGGLSKREYFAAKALEGLLANSKETWDGPTRSDVQRNMAKYAIEQADALIAELAKGKP